MPKRLIYLYVAYLEQANVYFEPREAFAVADSLIDLKGKNDFVAIWRKCCALAQQKNDYEQRFYQALITVKKEAEAGLYNKKEGEKEEKKPHKPVYKTPLFQHPAALRKAAVLGDEWAQLGLACYYLQHAKTQEDTDRGMRFLDMALNSENMRVKGYVVKYYLEKRRHLLSKSEIKDWINYLLDIAGRDGEAAFYAYSLFSKAELVHYDQVLVDRCFSYARSFRNLSAYAIVIQRYTESNHKDLEHEQTWQVFSERAYQQEIERLGIAGVLESYNRLFK